MALLQFDSDIQEFHYEIIKRADELYTLIGQRFNDVTFAPKYGKFKRFTQSNVVLVYEFYEK